LSPKPSIPFHLPSIGEDEINEVVATLRSGWLTTGPKAHEFEEAFKTYTGARHALAVNSCTAGLHLALAGLGIGPGDEVITTPLTFCATVNTILEVGATPVLADIGPDLNLDPAAVERAITPRTRAIIPVHFAGLPCEMDRLWRLAAAYDLKVVEDAAHAAGSRYRGVPIGGGNSDAVAFSFYATKNMTTGEGGMLTSRKAGLHERLRVLCLHGISHDAWNRYSDKGNWYYEVVECGFKCNLPDVLAAIGIHQLRKLDRMNARRAEIAAMYNRAFAGMAEVQLPPDRSECSHSWHLYALRLNLEELTVDRAEFLSRLRGEGIGHSVHFIPIPAHPYYRRHLPMRDACSLAMAEYPRLVSLPIYPAMTDADAGLVVESVRRILTECSRGRVFQLSA
jgi:dTDP-4-amino-4,6-dideoxygalactose transaminase